jgi:NADPH:quinone reductase-like Zn-dependent oxidoreductase
MKAIVCTKYGPPEVLQIQEVEKPAPKDDEVCIKILATAVTASDCIVRGFKLSRWRPLGLMMGLVVGFTKPRQPILGMVLAGNVESAGKAVTRFTAGDQVYGSTLSPTNQIRFGAYAEYVCLPESCLITRKPPNISYNEAAAIPYGAGLALYCLKKGKIQRGQNVLIYGASGAIGTAAVQLAKSFGTDVTGVCSTTNLELVKSLGADAVIDYTTTDAPDSGARYDLILDAVGRSKSSTFKEQCQNALAPQGRYISIDGVSPKNSLDELDIFNELIAAGQMKAVIDRCYPLEQIVEAHRYVDRGHKKGNVVITVSPDMSRTK